MTFAPEREDFWRVRSAEMTHAPFKEWQHFLILAPGVDMLINFSLTGPPGLTLGRDAERTGRVIAIVRAGGEWIGLVETAARVEVSRDGCRARFGEHAMTIADGVYHVVIDAPAHRLFVDAVLRPETVPITARRHRFAPGGHLDWSLTARLTVDARIEVAGTSFDVAGAAGYHDHNWGHFAWGDDFAWEWGSVLPLDGSGWAAVYSGVMNRARTELVLEQMFVWRDRLNVLAAGGPDVVSQAHGRCSARPALRLPRAMAALHARADMDVPRELAVAATGGDGEVTLRFTPEAISQLVVPSERDPRGVVAINECIGPAELRGRIGGEVIHWEGRGVFEFVR